MVFARTVNGDVPTEKLGYTQTHEHIFVDLTSWLDSDTYNSDERTAIEKKRLDAEVTMENLWWMQPHHAFGSVCRDNRRLDNVETAAEEVRRYHSRGGDTLVDVTCYGIGRDPEGLLEVARRTGLNIIAGTGYYVKSSHPPDMDEKTAEEIADEITSDVEEGMDDTTIRAGVIGEIGATHDFLDHDNEVKSFRAAALAQQRTGAPITVHPPFFYQEAHDVLDVLEDAGADLDNVILGHLDCIIRDDDSLDYLTSLAERDPYIQFDTFGAFAGYSPEWDKVFPQDEDRILELHALMEAGYGEQLLISQDMQWKINLTTYGGRGYDYILRDIVPRMRKRDFSQEDIDRILIDNPAHALGFAR